MSSLYDSLLERSGGKSYNSYFMMSCLWHGTDSHPSLMVREDGFRCLTCGKRGLLKQLDQKLGSHFRPVRDNTVSNILPAWKSWDEQYGGLEGIVEYAHKNLKRYPQYQSYYKKRGVIEYLDQGNLGYISGWAVIPIYNRSHNLIDLVVRSTRSKVNTTRYVCRPSNSGNRPLYSPNWGRVESSKFIYIPFGMFDSITFELLGLASITSITGKEFNIDQLPNDKRYIFVPDYGEESTAHKYANKIGWRARVKQLAFPDGTKDPDGVRREYGNEYLLNLIGA